MTTSAEDSNSTPQETVILKTSSPRDTASLLQRRAGRIFVSIWVLASACVAFRTLWPRPLGLADNGDGQRYICQLGLVPAGEVDRYWSFAIFNWVPEPAGSNLPCVEYPSVAVPILRLIQWWTSLTGSETGALDLRWLIAINCLLVGLLAAVVAHAVQAHTVVKVLSAGTFVVIVSDGTFANYAGSVAGEYPGLAGVAIMSVGVLYYSSRGASQWLGLVLVLIGAMLAVTSKTQGITLLLPVIILLVCIGIKGRRWHRRSSAGWAHRFFGGVSGRIVSVLLAGFLVVPALWMLEKNPKEFQAINPWELISVGILKNSPDPAADLREMGLGADLLSFAGDSVWEPSNIMADPAWENNKSLMTYGTAGKFLLEHPARAVTIANNAGNDYLATRPTYLGSYVQGSGQAPTQVDPSPVADVGRLFTGWGITPLVFFWVLVSIGAFFLIRKTTPGTFLRGFAVATIFLVACSSIQFFTAAFGEAIENTKHMVYGILAGALALVFLATGWIVHFMGDPSSHRTDTPYLPKANTALSP